MKKAIGILSVLLLMTGVAIAYAELTIEPNTQNIDVGDTGTYTVTLDTSDVGPTALQWSTSNPKILARIGGGSFEQFGSYAFDSVGGVQTFTLEVQPQDGATLGTTYHIKVRYLDLEGEVAAMVTGDVVPVPEVSTIALTSMGLIGLLGLVRIQRKH